MGDVAFSTDRACSCNGSAVLEGATDTVLPAVLVSGPQVGKGSRYVVTQDKQAGGSRSCLAY